MTIRLATPSLVAGLLFGAAFALGSCGVERSPAEERAVRAQEAGSRIVVGAAWPWQKRKNLLYRQGMELAEEEINRQGGVRGQRLEIVYRDDEESVDEARLVAQRFASNLNMVAVIGHLQSSTTLPAAVIYDRAGLLLLAPSASAPDLTRQGFPLVFRTTPSDDAIGLELADYAAAQAYERAIICYIANGYGRALANAFEKRVEEHGVSVIDRQSYDPSMQGNMQSMRRIVAGWKDREPDVIFLAGEVPQAAMIIAAARDMGITAPVVGGDAVGVRSLIQIGGAAVDGTVVPSRFHPDDPRERVQAFVAAFEEAYGVRPDAGAASAYDAVHLLAYGIEQAGSSVPAEIARGLRTAGAWNGVLGAYTFDEEGNLIHTESRLDIVRNGRFVPLPGARVAQY